MAGDFLSYVAQIGDFMSGDFLSGDFLTGYHVYIQNDMGIKVSILKGTIVLSEPHSSIETTNSFFAVQ